ncbi:hypothetical protein HELRODRAFT_164352 [Helobdella robusta]|uniref:STIM1/2 Orai1-activating region domain-containing protein n=1 Tax=Helobdella robusta TaxID=6412 RepID=T1EVB0_HELRO|nr:hypothetical protein HELRODRAFT_164352 [Helobdella robusta]ESN94495.1 hypothetical protein HELRODRAFT_164352 [Helobdella robusta]
MIRLDESLRQRLIEEDERDELVRKLMNKKELTKNTGNFCKCSNEEDLTEGCCDGGKDCDGDVGESAREDALMNLASLREELFQRKMELLEAERLLEEKKKTCMPHLQQWLQLTYEMESKAFEQKKAIVEKNLREAKQVCEKIKKQRFKLFGSLKQNQTEDRTDLVKDKLDELKREMEERCLRWKEIERLTSFNIITNPGVSYLNSLLRGSRMSLYTPANNQLTRSSTASSMFNLFNHHHVF